MLKSLLLFMALVGAVCLTPRAHSTPPDVISDYVLDFMDDFQDGIDQTNDWWCETMGDDQRHAAADGTNDYACCMGLQHIDGGDRCTGMLTRRQDLRDFIVMWDMRFHNDGFDRDRRLTYFRTTSAPWPVGYWVQVGVKTPIGVNNPAPQDWVIIAFDDGLGGATILTPKVEHVWELEHWYTFKLLVHDFDFKLKIWEKGTIEPANWFLETTDPQHLSEGGCFGFGNYWNSITDVDNVYIYVLGETPVESTTWSGIKALF